MADRYRPCSRGRVAPSRLAATDGSGFTRRYAFGLASRPDELHEPIVVEIDDEFSRLPVDERVRLGSVWLESLRTYEPIELSVTGAQMVAEARADMGW